MEPPASRRPDPSPWTQQKVPSFNPLLTPKNIMAALFAMGAVSITIGLSIRSVQADQIFQQKEQYDGDGTPDRNAACKIKEANAGTECEISISIKDKMESPVYVYYELENFYQNHQRYLASLDSDQLTGENLKKDDLSTCSPLKSNGSKTLNPCGVIANSLFNDVISLSAATELAHGVSMRENHLAWKSDLNDKFKQPDGFEWTTTDADVAGCYKSVCPAVVCTESGLPEGCMGYVCEGGDFDGGHCDEGQSVLYYYRDHDEFQFLYETFPDIVSPIVGVKNEHFVVWMRLAGLAEFKKLYGRITDTLHDGWTLTFTVTNNFNVKSFNGKKYLVVSTVSPLGANVKALWMAFTYFGVAACLCALFFLAKAHVSPRKLGDTAYLRAG